MAMAISLCAQAYPGESIVRDPATGNYTITYRSDSNSTELSQTVFVPSTKIDPAIRSRFHLGDRGIIAYRYSVSNGATAKQALVSVVVQEIANPILGELPPPFGETFPNEAAETAAYIAYNAAEKAATVRPPRWHGSISRDLSQVSWEPDSPIETGGIQPGRTLSGFGFSSLDLPGVGSSWMGGLANEPNDIFGFPDDGPMEDSAIFDELNRLRDNDFIVRPAAVPTIAVPIPFDAAVLLDRIRAHVATWPGKQLLDSSFATQLDRYMVAAADAYRRNQPKAGKENIQTLRKMLKKEHEDADRDDDKEDEKHEGKSNNKAGRPPIDRLAAKVLDFDLKYVAKRMGGDKDD